MKLVATTSLLYKTLGDMGAMRLLAGDGFDGIDLSITNFKEDSPWLRDDWKEYTLSLKEEAARLGVTFCQAHGPMPTSKGTEAEDAVIFGHVVRSMEVASLLGIPHIVIHPKQHLPYRDNAQELFRLSVEFYRELIPHCERLNIKVCTENMWQRNKRANLIVDSICARATEFRAMVDAVGSPWIVACLDMGHCGLVQQDPAEAIHTLGHDWLQAVHIHDVDLREDRHTLPFTQYLDWERITKALGEIDYTGNFTFEASDFITNFPQELWPDAALLMAKTGRYLMGRIENYRVAK